LNYEQGAELVRLAEERERMLMVGHVLEYHPRSAGCASWSPPASSSGAVHLLESPEPREDPPRGEHPLELCAARHRDLAQVDGRAAVSGVSVGGAYVQPNIADVTVTHLLFDNGVRAHIYVSWLHPFRSIGWS